MKKIYCICQAKDAPDTLMALRRLGVVHVVHQQPPQGKDISTSQEDIGMAASAMSALERFCRNALAKAAQDQSADCKLISRRICDMEKRLEQLRDYSLLLKAGIDEWEKWGDFDPHIVDELARRNIHIRFYQVPVKEWALLPDALIVKKIFQSKGIAYCVTISRDKGQIPYKEIAAPRISLSAMRRKLEDAKALEYDLKKDLLKYAGHYARIRHYRELLVKEFEFRQALGGMGEAGGFVYLAGYAPFDASDMLRNSAREKKWALLLQDPLEEDNVPTLIRNPRWVNMSKPVFKMFGIIPGYRELDVSAAFLISFSIFFGILIADVGYGLSYLCLTIWMQKRAKKPNARENIFPLFYLLCSTAIIWGMLTGTFFGQEWLIHRGLKGAVPSLNDVKFMQSLCFFLGALHLSIAHSWRAALKLPSLGGLADCGWICVLWTAFFLARTLIVGCAFPPYGIGLALTGIALVILFTAPQRNILKAVGTGLGTVALSLMNNFTDVVSYVRLFAVGLAAVAIADTTNAMSARLGQGAVAAVAGVLILVVGHGLNMALGLMSVLVHGFRLNVLEFSGHANVTWSGTPYEPLKESQNLEEYDYGNEPVIAI